MLSFTEKPPLQNSVHDWAKTAGGQVGKIYTQALGRFGASSNKR